MISIKDIQAARETISASIIQTPILSSQTISKKYANELFIKAEHLQKTGSFKIRGAANKVMLEARKGATHVVAASSGNHGQAVSSIAHV